jgi:hypothetical protein
LKSLNLVPCFYLQNAPIYFIPFVELPAVEEHTVVKQILFGGFKLQPVHKGAEHHDVLLKK